MLRAILLMSFVGAAVMSDRPMNPIKPPKISRGSSVLELAKQMIPHGFTEVAGRFNTIDIAQGLSSRGFPGKGLSEKTLPLDRQIANHLLVAEGFARPFKKYRAREPPSHARAPKTQEVTHSSIHQMMDESEEGNAEQTGDGLYYKVYGTGPQKVLMVMGLSASHAGWEYILPFLAHNTSKYQVAVFDNRGIGKSLCPEDVSDYSMRIFAHDTVAVADHLGWPKFHLVGFSMGGMICQTTASLFPDRLLSLALLATSARRTIPERIPPLTELPALLSWVMARSEDDKAEADLRMHFDDDYLKREFASGATIKDFWKTVYLSERAENSQGQHRNGFIGQLSALTAFRMRKREFAVIRERVRGPVLIMQGTKDRIIYPGSGASLFAYLAQGDMKGAPPLPPDRCRLVTMEAGHFLPIQKRREVAIALIELWEAACPEQGQEVGFEVPLKKRGLWAASVGVGRRVGVALRGAVEQGMRRVLVRRRELERQDREIGLELYVGAAMEATLECQADDEDEDSSHESIDSEILEKRRKVGARIQRTCSEVLPHQVCSSSTSSARNAKTRTASSSATAIATATVHSEATTPEATAEYIDFRTPDSISIVIDENFEASKAQHKHTNAPEVKVSISRAYSGNGFFGLTRMVSEDTIVKIRTEAAARDYI